MKQQSIKTQGKKTVRKPMPAMSWQTGEYQRELKTDLILPYQFLLLCKLMDVTPEQVLIDFMNNLSCSSWKKKGSELATEKLVQYFIEFGYGQHHYTPENIRTIFTDMEAMGRLWPAKADMDLIELHSKWISEYHSYWFNKWYYMQARRLL